MLYLLLKQIILINSEVWQEILQSIHQNRTRTLLSGFTIFLGIFIFIVLFGLGNGLNNGFEQKYKTKISNLITIKSGKISKSQNGINSNKELQLKNKDYKELINRNKSKIDQSSVIVSKEILAKYRLESGKYKLIGVEKTYKNLADLTLIKGRFINTFDDKSQQKNVIIGKLVEIDLFKTESSLGKLIVINGINYKIIGVFTQEANEIEERKIYTSYKTFTSVFNVKDNIESIVLTNNKEMSATEAIGLGHQLNNQLKEELQIDQTDQTAVQVNNKTEEAQDTDNFIFVLNLVVLLIGSGTLITGSIGISNIMIYIIKERYFEIGLRKALGAKPKDILILIMLEMLISMLFFGLIGIFAGILLLNLIGNNLSDIFIINPQVNTFQLLFSFFLLLFFG